MSKMSGLVTNLNQNRAFYTEQITTRKSKLHTFSYIYLDFCNIILATHKCKWRLSSISRKCTTLICLYYLGFESRTTKVNDYVIFVLHLKWQRRRKSPLFNRCSCFKKTVRCSANISNLALCVCPTLCFSSE